MAQNSIIEAGAMQVISGARLLDCPVHIDNRGTLIAFEQFDSLPFRPERVFLIQVDDPDTVRGGHANSCDEYILAMAGSVEIALDNGHERSAIRVHSGGQALWVRPGVLIALRAFEPGTCLLVCASARYADTRHFDRAQPHLIEAAGCS